MADAPEFDRDLQMAGFERTLGLPEGFIRNLENDDDWSFVIKAYALLEAGMSEMLVHWLNRPQLANLLSEMGMGGRFGKVAFGIALGLVDDEMSRFIDSLGRIRNAFAHKIANAGASLSSYFDGIGEEKFRALHKSLNFVFAERETVNIDGNDRTTPEMFKNNAKRLIAANLGLITLSHPVSHFGREMDFGNAEGGRDDLLVEWLSTAQAPTKAFDAGEQDAEAK